MKEIIEKATLRASMRILRDGVDPARRAEYAKEILRVVADWDRYRAARTVFIYASMGSEVDTWPLIERIAANGKSICLPRIRKDGEMDAVPYQLGDALVRVKYGALEPQKSIPAISPDEIDLILAPALALTRTGNRLGWGGGYYDRYFARCGAYRAALCFSAQIVDRLPVCEYDMGVHTLVTELGIWDCGRADR